MTCCEHSENYLENQKQVTLTEVIQGKIIIPQTIKTILEKGSRY